VRIASTLLPPHCISMGANLIIDHSFSLSVAACSSDLEMG
jgi:hypothetical protein